MGTSRERSSRLLLVGISLLLFFLLWGGGRAGIWLQSFVLPTSNSFATSSLFMEARIAVLEKALGDLEGAPLGAVPAAVYSRYPFNLKNELLIDIGSDRLIKVGDAVLYRQFFIGRIREVSSHASVVQTIFDNGMELPVRIGASAVDALLKGSADPELTLIPKNASLHDQDVVYTAVSGIHYGLPIGSITRVVSLPEEVFSRANLTFDYNPNEIRMVSVLPVANE